MRVGGGEGKEKEGRGGALPSKMMTSKEIEYGQVM